MLSNIEFAFAPYDELEETIGEAIQTYFLKDVYQDLEIEKTLGDYLAALREDLYFIVEYPYVDKVYRNSFYSYYASKHSDYQRDCIRVAIFDGEISPEDFSDPENQETLQSKFLGYFTLRPIKALFGRALINPLAFENPNYRICMYTAECFIFGIKLEVTGFPHSSQDGETISCAETTIWSVMEYFGTKYPDYRPVLPSVIIKTLEGLAIERQLPTGGLTMEHISYALKQFGFGTRIYFKEEFGKRLFEIIDAYVESGLPVMTGLYSKAGQFGHAVILVGKQFEQARFSAAKKQTLFAFGKNKTYYDSAQFSNHYVVQDDNLPPYRVITLKEPGQHYDDAESKAYEIDTVVIPLYPKIYLEAVVAKSLALEIIKDELLGYDFEDNFILRFFLTSSRTFKKHIANSPDMCNRLKQNMIIAKMPKFVWVAEIYTKADYNSGAKEAVGLIVLDATEANNVNNDALIFACYPDRFVGIYQNKFVSLPLNLKKYTYYSNLK